MTDYWYECIACSLEEAGVTATPEQVRMIADDVKVSHENYGMAHGHDCIPNPLRLENERLKREVAREREKRICTTCNGRGRIFTQGPVHSSDSQCDHCRGEGRC